MGRDNKRHPNGTVPIEPRSSAKPISEAPVPLLAAVIPVVLAPAAPPVVLSQPGTSRFLFFLQNLLTLLPLEQARQSAVFASQQPFFSQPGTSRFFFFLQNFSTLLPLEQARQSAVFALQQPLPPSPLWYFSQPGTSRFFF